MMTTGNDPLCPIHRLPMTLIASWFTATNPAATNAIGITPIEHPYRCGGYGQEHIMWVQA